MCGTCYYKVYFDQTSQLIKIIMPFFYRFKNRNSNLISVTQINHLLCVNNNKVIYYVQERLIQYRMRDTFVFKTKP